ncbi:alpha-hydroxy acid oxidase [Teredinibacter waterburyi]|jgi:L-lactate dehydrogenase (FMN-dependent) and related alpha-hydroxy acid dehydrogenases|uniref:alpha-hydroxy acid oxidase n=1 Tax=Teredinibacter waterburyi TaxID=1500538 RepID=UPI00165EC36C|nr:alpha-hydroxy acid oxidase [Teredinibacter waterburyi]
MLNSERPKLDRISAEVVCSADYERLAKDYIEDSALHYIQGGSGDERTLAENCAAFEAVQLYTRVLADCSGGTTAFELFGESYRHPIFFAPVAAQTLVHPNGELATARAAELMEACMVTSSLSAYSLEDIAAAAGGRKWFQFYFQTSREQSQALLARAEAAGYSAIVVTLDTPVQTLSRGAQRTGFSLPAHALPANLKNVVREPAINLTTDQSVVFQGAMAEAPKWSDLEWLRSQTQLPLLVKGVTHPDDALRCIDMGVDGLVVSNHGGRSLDGVAASLQLLPHVRAVVPEGYPLLIDGGIRSGSDVFKAIALGANAVMIGRPQLYALAVGGSLGVAHLMKILRDELEVSMALCGCSTLSEISASAIFTKI